jgi:hypothetical protein
MLHQVKFLSFGHQLLGDIFPRTAVSSSAAVHIEKGQTISYKHNIYQHSWFNSVAMYINTTAGTWLKV